MATPVNFSAMLESIMLTGGCGRPGCTSCGGKGAKLYAAAGLMGLPNATKNEHFTKWAKDDAVYGILPKLLPVTLSGPEDGKAATDDAIYAELNKLNPSGFSQNQWEPIIYALLHHKKYDILSTLANTRAYVRALATMPNIAEIGDYFIKAGFVDVKTLRVLHNRFAFEIANGPATSFLDNRQLDCFQFCIENGNGTVRIEVADLNRALRLGWLEGLMWMVGTSKLLPSTELTGLYNQSRAGKNHPDVVKCIRWLFESGYVRPFTDEVLRTKLPVEVIRELFIEDCMSHSKLQPEEKKAAPPLLEDDDVEDDDDELPDLEEIKPEATQEQNPTPAPVAPTTAGAAPTVEQVD